MNCCVLQTVKNWTYSPKNGFKNISWNNMGAGSGGILWRWFRWNRYARWVIIYNIFYELGSRQPLWFRADFGFLKIGPRITETIDFTFLFSLRCMCNTHCVLITSWTGTSSLETYEKYLKSLFALNRDLFPFRRLNEI